MMLSFVVRLIEKPLARGETVGQVESVATGRSTTFRNVTELMGFFSGEVPGAAPDTAASPPADTGASAT